MAADKVQGVKLEEKSKKAKDKMQEEATKSQKKTHKIKGEIIGLRTQMEDVSEKIPAKKQCMESVGDACKALEERIAPLRLEFEKVEDTSLSLHDRILALEQKVKKRGIAVQK